MNTLIELFRIDYKFLLSDLERIQRDSDGEYINVRLCADIDDDGDASWIIRSGDASYDQRHSQYCGASSIDIESNTQAVLEDLINQVMDQAADLESVGAK